jgi:hypothetical protein
LSPLLVTATTANAAPSPKGLYTALLTAPHPNSQLPSGTIVAKVRTASPGETARAYHVVGDVEADVVGLDPVDEIAFAVYPNSRDARAEIRHVKPSNAQLHLHLVAGGVPGYANPLNRMWEGSVVGKNDSGHAVKNGTTVVEIAMGNVLVAAITLSIDNKSKGNVRHALALLKSGLLHLRKVEAHLARARPF